MAIIQPGSIFKVLSGYFYFHKPQGREVIFLLQWGHELKNRISYRKTAERFFGHDLTDSQECVPF